MPFYMDRHEFNGLTAAGAAEAHVRDLEVQDRFDVKFVFYWFDEERQTAFCLAEAPSREAMAAVHLASHGLIPNQIIEVERGDVERFLGRIVSHPPGEPYVDTAFRTILFTDIEGSTELTQRLGDSRAMALLRAHDRIVGDALARNGGSEVKHTGDGLMASFRSVVGGITAAMEIQRELASDQIAESDRIRLRVGVAAGEPVTERGDLFGAAVQLAARLCQRARPGTILVSSGVRDLALGKGFAFGQARRLRLKGFEGSQVAYEVGWG